MQEFNQEVRERKNLANQAKSKKNGSKSKLCTLPHENITNREWKKMNGPITTYSLKQPMKWAEFKILPHDLQKSYLKAIENRFNATKTKIAEDCFGVNYNTFNNYINSIGGYDGIKYSSGRRMSPEELEKWNQWTSVTVSAIREEPATARKQRKSKPAEVLKTEEKADTLILNEDAAEVTAADAPKESVAEPVASPVESTNAVSAKPMGMSSFNIAFSGVPNIDNIANTLRVILGNESREAVVDIKVSF